jgi:hypothetical protein
MTRLDQAEEALLKAAQAVAAAIDAKTDVATDRRQALLRRVALLRIRAARHDIPAPPALSAAETLLALDEPR